MFEKMIFGEEVEEETEGITVTKNTCNSCGGVFCSDGSKVKNCIFCGSTSLSSEKYVEPKEYSMIPFNVKIEEAKKEYHKKTFWNPLVPFQFKTKNNKNSIQKVFIPTLLVNAKQSGKIVFLGGEKRKAVHNDKRCFELKKYEVVQSVNVDYNQVLLNASNRIEDKVFFNICKYDFDKMDSFGIDNLKDCTCLMDDFSVREIGEKGRERITKYTLSMARENVGHELKKLGEDQTTIAFHDAKAVMVPAYLLNVVYNNKNYQFLMNGENGKSYCKLPIGILSSIIFGVVVSTLVFVIAYLVALKF